MSAVLIAGAGPTGLTLSCGLAAAGVPVRSVDAADGPPATSRANILHARGVEVLDRVGALGDLRERSLQPMGMTVHAGRHELATMRFLPDRREATRALFVSQAAIEARLRQRLADLGVGVEWGTSVEGAAQDADGVTVRFGGGATARVDWLVGCDGAHSQVRHAAGIPFPGVPVVEQSQPPARRHHESPPRRARAGVGPGAQPQLDVVGGRRWTTGSWSR
jgi:2-polyprenyl-6-methoxyphenol hydroxylase-like FAD-dependent oxidoreductase